MKHKTNIPVIGIITIAPAAAGALSVNVGNNISAKLKTRILNFIILKIMSGGFTGRLWAKHRLRSLWYLAAGRAAAQQALKDGCGTILINTYHSGYGFRFTKMSVICFMVTPLRGQLTAQCPLQTNKNGKLPLLIDWLYKLGTQRLARDGALFLGMSRWYLEGLKRDFGVPEKQLVELPFGLDLRHWRRREIEPASTPKKGLDILFVGDPFEGKGGCILQEVAAMSEFSECTFHFVGRTIDFPNEGRCRYYKNLAADSEELLQIFSRCNLMVLPTYSDFSPNVAIEALAMGLPVIITGIAAISDIVRDGGNRQIAFRSPGKGRSPRKNTGLLE